MHHAILCVILTASSLNDSPIGPAISAFLVMFTALMIAVRFLYGDDQPLLPGEDVERPFEDIKRRERRWARGEAALIQRAGAVEIWDVPLDERAQSYQVAQVAPLRLMIRRTPGPDTDDPLDQPVEVRCHTASAMMTLREALTLIPGPPCPVFEAQSQRIFPARLLKLSSAPNKLELALTAQAHPEDKEVRAYVRDQLSALIEWLQVARWPESAEALLLRWAMSEEVPEAMRVGVAEQYFLRVTPDAEGDEAMWSWACQGDARRAALVVQRDAPRYLSALPPTLEAWAQAIDALRLSGGEELLDGLDCEDDALPEWSRALAQYVPAEAFGARALPVESHRVLIAVMVRVWPGRLVEAMQQVHAPGRWACLERDLSWPLATPLAQALTRAAPAEVFDQPPLREEARDAWIRQALRDAPDALLPRLGTPEQWAQVLRPDVLHEAPDAALAVALVQAPDWRDGSLSVEIRAALWGLRVLGCHRAALTGGANAIAQLDALLDEAHARDDMPTRGMLAYVTAWRVTSALGWLARHTPHDLDDAARALEVALSLALRAERLDRLSAELRRELEQRALTLLDRAVTCPHEPGAGGCAAVALRLIEAFGTPRALRALGQLHDPIAQTPALMQALPALQQTLRALRERAGDLAVGGLSLSADSAEGGLSIVSGEGGGLSLADQGESAGVANTSGGS